MIKQFTLPNGAGVVCEHVESVRSVTVGVWIRAGSRYEDAGRLGVSHFIEHMLFKGTQKRTAKRIAEEIDYIGGHINAFTAKDCTCFYTKTLDRHLDIGLDILSDILQNSLLSEADADLERNVILEEINMYEDTPDELAHDLLAEGVWRNCSLGNPIMGRPDTIAGIDGRVMRKHICEEYTADNMVISVAGSFDDSGLAASLEAAFGKIPARGARDARGARGVRDVRGTRDTLGVAGEAGAESEAAGGAIDSYMDVSYEPGRFLRVKDTEQIHLCVGFDGVGLGCDDIYALQLASSAFGGGMSSVLFQKIREELGLVYSIYSYTASYVNAGMFTVYAGMQPEQAGRVYEMITGELKAFRQAGVTPDLLLKLKDQFKGGYIMGLESPNARMSALGKSKLLLGYVNAPDEIVAKVDNVTLDDVYGVMDKVFDPGRLALSAVGRVDEKLESVLV